MTEVKGSISEQYTVLLVFASLYAVNDVFVYYDNLYICLSLLLRMGDIINHSIIYILLLL